MAASEELTAAREVITCRGERFRRYLDHDAIQERNRALGAQISRAYEGKRPILIGVLNGAFMFLADLMKTITIDCEVDFMKLSSYGEAKVSSGRVTELKSIDAPLEGRHVIIVEDIVDSGLTMEYILDGIRQRDVASVKVATLLHKTGSTEADLTLDYVGFEIPDLFVIGYGLDYGQIARNLPHIYILDEGDEEAA